jgi:hypothetical protein
VGLGLPEQPGHLNVLAAAARKGTTDENRVITTCDGLTLTVTLEDRDPLRSRLGLTPAPPLSPSGRQRWERALGEAWRLLVTYVRPQAEAMAAVLTCVVPVEADPAARGISATSADAYGAVAISEPADAAALAVGLLHEAQHSILNAVLYLFDLLEDPGARGYSPWRDDPRPSSGILQGAYAYLSVTRFWRAHPADRLAEFEFARWREAVTTSARELTGLTPAGQRFVGALLAEAEPWRDEPVEPEVARLAAGANRDHLLRWRLRNRRVEPPDAERLAGAWRRGEEAPAVTSRLVPAPRRALEASARLDLAHGTLRGVPVTGAEADLAYVRGDAGSALVAYARKPVDWPGLILTSGLPAAPEVAAAAHAALDGEPDPIAIARWLS